MNYSFLRLTFQATVQTDGIQRMNGDNNTTYVNGEYQTLLPHSRYVNHNDPYPSFFGWSAAKVDDPDIENQTHDVQKNNQQSSTVTEDDIIAARSCYNCLYRLWWVILCITIPVIIFILYMIPDVVVNLIIKYFYRKWDLGAGIGIGLAVVGVSFWAIIGIAYLINYSYKLIKVCCIAPDSLTLYTNEEIDDQRNW